jgi:NAD(P)H-hydrate epimerase
MLVLSRSEMYNLDKETTQTTGISGKVLMENAGKGCSEKLQADFLTENNQIALFCGTGNNGGDGFVIARYLYEWNHKPTIFLVGNPAKMSVETHENYEKCKQLHIPVYYVSNKEDWKNLKTDLNSFELVVDAIFGIGFNGDLRGWLCQLIEEMNQTKTPKAAIDIASGLDADNGITKLAVKAVKTYTMAALKYGHFLGNGKQYSGMVEIIDIGIPDELFLAFPPKAKLITEQNVVFPERFSSSHKGDYGKIGIIAGSTGFSGAAILAAQAALRAGGGLITLFHPAGMETIFETQLLEVMTQPISEKNNHYDWEKMKGKIEHLDVLLVGPGLGTSSKIIAFLEQLFQFWQKPLVIDADGLNAIAKNKTLLSFLRNKPVLLTPHVGEFSRLIGKDIEEILQNPLEEIAQFAQKNQIQLLLKSATSVFTDGERFLFNISGNDALSTGGSGDVLAGIITSFIGQKMNLANSAMAASYLLGKTAENLSRKRKPASIIPSDIIEHLFVY